LYHQIAYKLSNKVYADKNTLPNQLSRDIC